MSLLRAVLLGFAATLVASGLFAPVSAWAFPRMLDAPFLRGTTTGKAWAPTRAKRTLLAFSSMLLAPTPGR